VRPVPDPVVRLTAVAAHTFEGAAPVLPWPVGGQAVVDVEGLGTMGSSGGSVPTPTASVAKVMTAYVVLRHFPLQPEQSGPSLTIRSSDVADTARRRARQESVVDVAAGEKLTEQQALQALLLPSANNIAAVLARWVAGSQSAFVAQMNAAARDLGLRHTRYTDPSGFDADTVSTAGDQVRVVEAAMNRPVFAQIVATRTAFLPVAGLVHNTDSLLGRHGFVGVKTGSDDAAGGCFAFRSIRWINGRRTVITGVVLGQPGHNELTAGQNAADAMVDRIAAG
jgi:serine-type D-Ala-D-Ala carboxypeptidase (penicillin-binding protein 5/6)